MNLQNLPYWGQLLVIVGVCAGMGFVFFQFMYTPEVKQVRDLKSNLQKLNAEIQLYKPFENRREELNQEIVQIRQDLKQLEQVFPSVKDDVEVKRFVETIANEFDIQVNSYKASSISETENYLERIVVYKSLGRTIDYLRFFNSLSRRGQVIHIYSLSMSQSRGGESADGRYSVSADFTISSYVYKPLPAGSLLEGSDQ